jgi:hypothetical protein
MVHAVKHVATARKSITWRGAPRGSIYRIGASEARVGLFSPSGPSFTDPIVISCAPVRRLTSTFQTSRAGGYAKQPLLLPQASGYMSSRITAVFVYPPGPTEMAAVRRTAEVAIKDNSCPSCRDEPGPSSAAATRAGMTQDGRLPQPSCGLPVVQGLAAPPFFAAEWPRRLLAESAPFGMRMGGKSERESVQTLRRYQRNLSQPLRCAYATCAVVGSAGSLRGTDFGAAIDAHAAVVRVNAAPVRGHEGAVGRRTTWRVHNSEKPYFMASLGHRELQLVVCHMQWIGACQHLAFGGAFADTASLVTPRFYNLSPQP